MVRCFIEATLEYSDYTSLINRVGQTKSRQTEDKGGARPLGKTDSYCCGIDGIDVDIRATPPHPAEKKALEAP